MGDRVTASLHFWLRLSLLCLTVRGLLSSFSWIAARRSMTAGKSTGANANRPIMAAFWFTLGCAFISYRQIGIPPLENITILARRSDSSFQMMTEKGQTFEVTFCADTHVDFREGERLQILRYEQRTGCKSLNGRNLGFIAYTDRDGNRVHYPITKEIADVRPENPR